jgi:Tol biopolymer transport system component
MSGVASRVCGAIGIVVVAFSLGDPAVVSARETPTVVAQGVENPHWALDRTSLVFGYEPRTAAGEIGIYKLNIRSKQLTNLTPMSGRSFDPAWSPDAKRIVYTNAPASSLGNPSIWVMNADGGSKRRLASGGQQAAWSPDGHMIAYVSEVPGQEPELRIISPNGKPVRRMKLSGYAPRFPFWSPDSRRIAFRTNSGTYAIGRDGRGLRRLVAGPRASGTWSDDWKRVAYVDPADSQLHVADVSGGHLTTLTHGRSLVPSGWVAWSPAGNRIVFTMAKPNSSYSQLFVVNLDGTGLHLLVS